MSLRYLPLLFIFVLEPAVAELLFVTEEEASPYDHDRIGKLAGQALVRLCGEQTFEEGRDTLASLPGWERPQDEAPVGVVIREQAGFGGQKGLTARFRIASKSCSLTLSPYLPGARAADELVYGISEAADKAFSDPELPYRVEQSLTGLRRVGPGGHTYEQEIYLQWMQRDGIPSHGYFARFDKSGEVPRVMLGKRPFTGSLLFGMADGDWEKRRNRLGENILLRQSKDPVDTQTGGYNTIAFSRNKSGRYTLKAFLSIGADSDSFRIKSSLGRAAITGFDALRADRLKGGRIESITVPVRQQREFSARKALLSKGLYPVYLQLDDEAMQAIDGADLLTVILRRKGGSKIALQIPAGKPLRNLLREHLDYSPRRP